MPAWEVSVCSASKIALAVKRLFNSPLLFIFFAVQWIPAIPVAAAAADWSSWKNFYGIAWLSGSAETADGVTYAKQMGHDYMAVRGGAARRTAYANNLNRAGLKFYIVNPGGLQDIIPTITTIRINTASSYTQEQINYFESNMAMEKHGHIPK